tara:strand:- start:737 stop:958 length:222 start_codon:yes stop_codon:yes gene_type:complete
MYSLLAFDFLDNIREMTCGRFELIKYSTELFNKMSLTSFVKKDNEILLIFKLLKAFTLLNFSKNNFLRTIDIY